MNLSPRNAKAEEKALWKVIRDAKIDEVMFFVPHAEEVSTGLGTDAENEEMAAVLAPIFDRLREKSIAPSINMWWTVGFSDFPSLTRNQHDRFKFRWAVNLDGRESAAMACPQDRAWREQIKRMYRTYARLNPVRIWIDDDVRMTLRADMQCPCFCDVCLGEMARRTGRSFTRPELLKGILADPPNPVRNAWFDFQEELERGIVSELAKAVHEVSPSTRVSLMFSMFEIHWAEGRRWPALVAALDTSRPHMRPGIGPYSETTAYGIATGLTHTLLTQAALPADVVLAPEIENYPQTRFAKSAAMVRADLLFAQLMGISEMTFSIYRFSGRLDLEVKHETIWQDMMGGIKPRLQAIADLGITREQLSGVSLYWHEESARHARGVTNEPKPIFVYRERPWDQALPLLGISARYGVGDVTAFAGEHIACLDEAALKSTFSRGVLLDARAAETLLLMGHGDLAGLVKRKANVGMTLETIEDPDFGDLADDPMNCRWFPGAWQFDWAKGARVVSCLREYRRQEIGHGLVLFENKLGGRVAIYPYDSQERAASIYGAVAVHPFCSPSFLSWTRQSQMRATLEWLGRKRLPLFVPEAPTIFPILASQEKRLVAGVANLLPDPIPSLKLAVAQPVFPIKRVKVLDEQGKWRTCRARISRPSKGIVSIDTGHPLPYLDVAVVILE
jgi:hypothetical protein